MSDIIQLLPDSIANQIAAGEVVQRPASAVKELMENSVDAGSSKIILKIQDSGKNLIQVIDDGAGMSETDARMCLERHATSKIKKLSDLYNILTLGFRGEAIASIAAVSRVEIKTKRNEDETGTKVCVEASTLTTHEPLACNSGTTISVKNLFYNVPARRNFLKSNSYELKLINDEFLRIAIANPQIHFEFYDGDKTVYQLNKSNLRKRLINIFGKKHDNLLVPVDEKTTIINVSGFIGKPENSKKHRGEQFFFVNNRFIKSPYLHHAVMNAYDKLISDQSFPFYTLFIETDPAKIDINVHPTKTEIKFEDEKSVYAIINAVIKRSLSQYHIAPSLDFDLDDKLDHISNSGSSTENIRLNTNPEPENSHIFFNKGFNKHSSDKDWEELYKILSIPQGESDNQQDTDQNDESLLEDIEFKGEKQIIQIHNKYLLTPIRSGIMLVNKQKAHERILFEKYLKYLEKHNSHSQQLLFPELIHLNEVESRIIRDIIKEILYLGFDIEEFGKNDFLIKGLPADMPTANAKKTLEEFIENYKYNSKTLSINKNENIARTMAKTASVKQNKKLSSEESSALIDVLFACETPYFTPDGKPTFITIAINEIDKKFDKYK